jgi:hypothetical protein
MKIHSKGLVPIGHIQIKANILEKGNITGVSKRKSAWADELGLPENGEYTFFAGCGYQYMKYAEGMVETLTNMEKIGVSKDAMVALSNAFGKMGVDLPTITAKVTSGWRSDAYSKILVHSVNVLQKLGINLGYLHEEEPCCGSPLYYAGFIDECIEKAKNNYQLFRTHDVQKLIGVVPACVSMIKTFYSKYIEDFDLEVHHLLEIVAKSMKEKKITPRLKEKKTVTYHDPCQLSRYLRIIDEPRQIMMRIEGLKLVEPKPEQCGQWSTCCGGGGLEAVERDLSLRLGVRRIEELLETGAKTITTSCPACLMQLKKAAREVGSGVEVVDLVQIIDEALE